MRIQAETWKLVAKFLGGLVAAIGVIWGGVLGWKKYKLDRENREEEKQKRLEERKKEESRIYVPTSKEVDRYAYRTARTESSSDDTSILGMLLGALLFLLIVSWVIYWVIRHLF
jgi:flagellar biogenesis protein FliO